MRIIETIVEHVQRLTAMPVRTWWESSETIINCKLLYHKNHVTVLNVHKLLVFSRRQSDTHGDKVGMVTKWVRIYQDTRRIQWECRETLLRLSASTTKYIQFAVVRSGSRRCTGRLALILRYLYWRSCKNYWESVRGLATIQFTLSLTHSHTQCDKSLSP